MVFGGETWDRLPDQEVALQRLVALADEINPHLILIAGDLYDTARPRTEAEKLIAKVLPQLSQNGERVVIVIAGNHDSRTGLVTYQNWALPLGIVLIGSVNDTNFYRDERLGQKHRITSPVPGLLEIQIEGLPSLLQVYVFPHVYSTSWEGAYESLEGEKWNYAETWQRLPEQYGRRGAYQVFVGHSFCVAGAATSQDVPDEEQEGRIGIGPDQPHSTEVFPERLQYIALGHLHRPHQVGGRPVYYPGSLLWYGPQHANIERQVLVATWNDPAKLPQVESRLLDLSDFRYQILETDDLTRVKEWVTQASERRRPLWLRWKGTKDLPLDLLHELSQKYYFLYRSEVASKLADGGSTQPDEALRTLIMSGSKEDLFGQFLRHKSFPEEDIQKALHLIFVEYAPGKGEEGPQLPPES